MRFHIHFLFFICYNTVIVGVFMLNIEFEIDEDIIARKMISRSCMPAEFANNLWGKYNEDYKIPYQNIPPLQRAYREYTNHTLHQFQEA